MQEKKKIFFDFFFFTWLSQPEIFSSTINRTKNSGLTQKKNKSKKTN
jgi:hypothetical protein